MSMYSKPWNFFKHTNLKAGRSELDSIKVKLEKIKYEAVLKKQKSIII